MVNLETNQDDQEEDLISADVDESDKSNESCEDTHNHIDNQSMVLAATEQNIRNHKNNASMTLSHYIEQHTEGKEHEEDADIG